MTWMMSGEKTFTSGGQFRAASLVTVCQWVKESWQELSTEMVYTNVPIDKTLKIISITVQDMLGNTATVTKVKIEKKFCFKLGSSQ